MGDGDPIFRGQKSERYHEQTFGSKTTLLEVSTSSESCTAMKVTSSSCSSKSSTLKIGTSSGKDFDPQLRQKLIRKSLCVRANPGKTELGTVILDKIGDGRDIAPRIILCSSSAIEIVSKFTRYVRELKNDGHDDHATGGPSTRFPCRTYSIK